MAYEQRFADETKQTELIRLKARQRFDPRARYDITDARGTKIGEIQKVFGDSLLRSRYRLYDATGAEVANASEKSLPVALIRRFIGLVPFFGGFTDWGTPPLPLRLPARRHDPGDRHPCWL